VTFVTIAREKEGHNINYSNLMQTIASYCKR
jgi:hypothetical protein